MSEEITHVFVDRKHPGNPTDCERCRVSVRPPCSKCGHALTGKVENNGNTVCETCGHKQHIGE